MSKSKFKISSHYVKGGCPRGVLYGSVYITQRKYASPCIRHTLLLSIVMCGGTVSVCVCVCNVLYIVSDCEQPPFLIPYTHTNNCTSSCHYLMNNP